MFSSYSRLSSFIIVSQVSADKRTKTIDVVPIVIHNHTLTSAQYFLFPLLCMTFLTNTDYVENVIGNCFIVLEKCGLIEISLEAVGRVDKQIVQVCYITT